MSTIKKEKEKNYEISFPAKGFDIAISEFPRTLLGKTMYDIHFFTGVGCKDKKSYKELLKATAEGIIKQVKENKF